MFMENSVFFPPLNTHHPIFVFYLSRILYYLTLYMFQPVLHISALCDILGNLMKSIFHLTNLLLTQLCQTSCIAYPVSIFMEAKFI